MKPPSDQDERPGHPPRLPLSGAAAGSPSTAPPLRMALPADWVAPSIARDRFDHWLRDLAWPVAQREDLVLALSEAVSNSVEHGYGVPSGSAAHDSGVVEVRAELVAGPDHALRVVLTVRDAGGWREPADSAHRGHGLRMIRAGGDEVVIDGTDGGTTITLTSRPAPRGRRG
ncbi:ATP-binding protein [Pseudonocardia sichuanensis]